MLRKTMTITDTNNGARRWYQVRIEEADERYSVESYASAGTALINAVDNIRAIEYDHNVWSSNIEDICANIYEHHYPVIITACGDYHNVIFTIEEREV